MYLNKSSLLPIMYLLFHSIGTSLHSIISSPPPHTIILSCLPPLFASFNMSTPPQHSFPPSGGHICYSPPHSCSLVVQSTPLFLSLSLLSNISLFILKGFVIFKVLAPYFSLFLSSQGLEWGTHMIWPIAILLYLLSLCGP